MILKGSQRGGAQQLVIHLLRTDENDHVELHEVRGFIADDLGGALREAYAISKGTRCQQFLFSLSLSPPEKEAVPVDVFERALDAIEAKLGLQAQPRVVVFHEKNGRRHAHCAWSRIDAERMRAINLPHFKLKLRDMSRELFIEHGWLMPRGLVNSAECDPRNFTRAEWQQAKRADRDPAALKGVFQDCWAISDSRKAFVQALAARGLYLARGDRRGFVAVDVKGEVFAIARWTGLKTKVVESRLGDPDQLPSVAETKSHIISLQQGLLGQDLARIEADHRAKHAPLQGRHLTLRRVQRERRAMLLSQHADRAAVEARLRAARFRPGLRGFWDRLIGRYAVVKRENETDAALSARRDVIARDSLIQHQLQERCLLKIEMNALKSAYEAELMTVYREMVDLDEPPHEVQIADRDKRLLRLLRSYRNSPNP